MRKCIICQEKRVKRPEYYYCSGCYEEHKKVIKWSERILKVLGEHGLRDIFWKVLWIFGLKKETRKQERVDKKEKKYTIGFEDTVLTKEGREKVKDVWQEQVEREYADEQAKERQSRF